MSNPRIPARRGHKHKVSKLLSDTLTQGDILYVNSSGDLALLPIGSDNQILAVNGSDVNWETGAGGGGISNIVEDVTPQLGADLEMQGFNLQAGGVIFLTEQAAADGDVAGEGQIWVKTATPNQLWFTDDAGTDFQLGVAEVNDLSAAVTWANVPDANITESSVTQHEAALTLSEAQVEAALSAATAFTANNYVFNVDQTVGAGQDNYVLTYDNGTGEIGLEAAAGGGGLSNIVEDVTPQLGADLEMQGFNLQAGGVVFLTEQAAADADVAAEGQVWVKSDTPNTLYFTDDAGSDWKIPKEQIKYKATDESISSDATYSTDSDLAGFVMDNDTWYMLEGYLQTSTAINVDIKFRGVLSQTVQDGAWTITGRNSGGTSEGDFGPSIATSPVVLDANNSNEHGFVVSGFIRSNATTGGTFGIEWAQNTSDAATTTVHAGSWLKLTKLT